MDLHAVGIDLGKTVLHLVGLDSSGTVVVRKRCSRTQLLGYTANMHVHLVGMEAYSGSQDPDGSVKVREARGAESSELSPTSTMRARVDLRPLSFIGPPTY